jgi:hypothetical protein
MTISFSHPREIYKDVTPYVTISAIPNIIYLSGASNQSIETTLKYQLYSTTPNNYTCTISSDSSTLGISGSRATQGTETVTLPSIVQNYKFTYTCTNTKIAEVLSSSTIVQVVNGICDNRYHYGCKTIGNKYSSNVESFCTRLDGAGANDCTRCKDWDPITISLLSQPCTNGKMNVFSMVFGGFKPYTKYTWYYRAASDMITNPNPWVVAENIPCINSNDCGSYEYDFSKLTQSGNGSYQYYLRVEDCLGESGASDIFTTTCTNSSRCGIDEYGKFFCSVRGTGTGCDLAKDITSECGTCKKR